LRFTHSDRRRQVCVHVLSLAFLRVVSALPIQILPNSGPGSTRHFLTLPV
jgi:hypothetical protein